MRLYLENSELIYSIKLHYKLQVTVKQNITD